MPKGARAAHHVHEDVADHDGRHLVLVPLVLELGQELRVVRRLHLLSNRPQVRSDRVRQALVELVPELVQHHVVRVAVELLEAQPTGVLLVDLVDRVMQ